MTFTRWSRRLKLILWYQFKFSYDAGLRLISQKYRRAIPLARVYRVGKFLP
jgi:hypothetical protein